MYKRQVEAGVPTFGEGIFSVFCDWLHRSLHVEQGLSQFGDVIRVVDIHNVLPGIKKPGVKITPGNATSQTGFFYLVFQLSLIHI